MADKTGQVAALKEKKAEKKGEREKEKDKFINFVSKLKYTS